HLEGGAMGGAARPRASTRRSVYERHVRDRARLHRRPAGAGDGFGGLEHAFVLAATALADPLHLAPVAEFQPAQARANKRRASLCSRLEPLFAVSLRRPAIQLRLFRETLPIALRPVSRKKVPIRRL